MHQGWPLVALADVLEEPATYGVVQPGQDTPRGVPIVRVKDVRNGVIDTNDPLRVAGEIARRYARTQLTGGEVVVSLVGTVGESAVVPASLAGWNVARAIAVLKPKYVSAEWVRICFQSGPVQQQLNERLNTTVQATLNLKDLNAVRLPMPPAIEQRGIAEVLGALDDKIAANTRLIRGASELAITLAGTGTGVATLSDVAQLARRSVNPGTMAAQVVDHYSLPAFDEGMHPESVAASKIKSGKFAVDGTCVLLSKLNPRFPRIWDVVHTSKRPNLASTEFLVLTSQWPSSVLWSMLSQPWFGRELDAKVAGTTGSHQRVRPDEIMSMQVIDPRSMGEAVRGQIAGLGEIAFARRAESRTLAMTRDELLPLLMSGNVRVKDAEKAVEGVA
jgi:type I restriction enzyme, S subunit